MWLSNCSKAWVRQCTESTRRRRRKAAAAAAERRWRHHAVNSPHARWRGYRRRKRCVELRHRVRYSAADLRDVRSQNGAWHEAERRGRPVCNTALCFLVTASPAVLRKLRLKRNLSLSEVTFSHFDFHKYTRYFPITFDISVKWQDWEYYWNWKTP